ncbi:MAG: glycosyltransferase N-terminal domain-containing protein [Ignavibacteriaceae bacterium]
MKTVWYLVYDFIVIPFLYTVLQFAGIFNSKIKRGIKGRRRVYEEIILNALSINKNKKLVWFHSSSLGEFEQAKPIIEELKQNRDINILITFFSPSGYENSKKYPYAELIAYIPFDTIYNARKFISIVKPDLAVIMRYDIWPNMIKALSEAEIPVFLVDATMRGNSLRKLPVIRYFHKILFNSLTKILTVSETDENEFSDFGVKPEKIISVGDTRFDRVYQRSHMAKEKHLIKDNILLNKKVFVFGSSWEQDEEVVFPAFIKLAEMDASVIMIVAPHEPTLLHLEKIENEFSGKLKSIRFSFLNSYKDERVIIVDSIGILLTLYTYADAAFIGGSFKQSIHNVLEAAVYGIPVIFGPKIDTSQEAKKLLELGGGILVRNKKEAYKNLRVLFSNDELRKNKGQTSYRYVRENLGATKRILDEIYNFI